MQKIKLPETNLELNDKDSANNSVHSGNSHKSSPSPGPGAPRLLKPSNGLEEFDGKKESSFNIEDKSFLKISKNNRNADIAFLDMKSE